MYKLVALFVVTVAFYFARSSTVGKIQALTRELHGVVAEINELQGVSRQVEENRPGFFSFFIAGAIDGVSIAAIGAPVGALAVPFSGDKDASAKQRMIAESLGSKQKEGRALLADIEGAGRWKLVWTGMLLLMCYLLLANGVMEYQKRNVEAGKAP